VTDGQVAAQIRELTAGVAHMPDYVVDTLALGVAKIAASRYPDPVIVRMSDFKSNEYRGLLGGEFFEPREENPMLGLRGASRYYHPVYRDAFELECRTIKRARDEAVKWMIARVIETAHQHGCKVGICGQAPSYYPYFAAFLVQCGIDSISLRPASVLPACRRIAAAEAALGEG